MHLNYIFFNKLFSFLAILIPLALITGGFIPDLFLTLIALYFLIKCIHLNYWELFKNKIVILFLIFVLIISLNSLFSSDPFISFFTSIVYIRYLFFSLAIAYFIRYEKNFINYLLASIGLCLIIIIPDTYFQWLTGKNIFGWTSYAENRLSSFFKDELIVGNYISKIFMLMTILLIHQNYSNNLVKLLNTILLIIVNFIVFASGERAAFFHIFSFTIMIVIFSENNFFYFKKFVIISFALFFIIIAFSFESNLKNRMIDHTINQINNKSIPFLPYSKHHEEHYLSALKMFIDKPLIGQGSGLFRYLCLEEKFYKNKLTCSSHPHNFYIQLLAENGVIGAIFLITLYLFLIKIILYHFFQIYFLKRKESIDLRYLTSSIVLSIYFWPIIPTMDFFNQWQNILHFFAFGFFLSYFLGSKIKKLN